MKVVGIAAWLCGLFAYLTTGRVFWNELSSPGGWKGLVYWFGLFVLLTAVVILGPPMFLLRDRIVAASARPGGVFVALGFLLGIMPIVLFISVHVGTYTLVLPENWPFYSFFGLLGAGFGAVFYLASVRR